MAEAVGGAVEPISIHALREEGDGGKLPLIRKADISIHALREEGDSRPGDHCCQRHISIHALREEGDQASAPC